MRTGYVKQFVTVGALGCLLTLLPMGCATAASSQNVARENGKVKVFVLAGQSNMEGHGVVQGTQKGSLETLSKDPATAKRYEHLLDKDGKWIVRDDVYLYYYEPAGKLTIGRSAAGNSIGPELAFGWTVGDYIKDPVLLIKWAPGGTALAGPWRPPSSGNAGDTPRGEKGVGSQYDLMIKGTKAALASIDKDFPELAGRGYELVGFGWHQGWNDGCSHADSREYEANMANFIRDVRKDLDAPDLPFVIGGSGFGGWEQSVDRRLLVMAAQKATAEREEFAATTRYVETRPFFRDGPVSPRPIRYHWCCNAESYYLVGEGMGKAMVELLGGPKAPANPTGPEDQR